MTPERNALMEHAYPRLKEYCRTKYRFEFQVIYNEYYTICVVTILTANRAVNGIVTLYNMRTSLFFTLLNRG